MRCPRGRSELVGPQGGQHPDDLALLVRQRRQDAMAAPSARAGQGASTVAAGPRPGGLAGRGEDPQKHFAPAHLARYGLEHVATAGGPRTPRAAARQFLR